MYTDPTQRLRDFRRKKIITEETKIEFDKTFLERYSILHEDYRIEKWTSHSIIFIDLIRNILIPFFVVFLQNYTIHQMIAIISVNFLTLVYLFAFLPYVDKKNNIMGLFNEAVLLIVSILCFILARIDQKEEDQNELRILIGWTIYYFDLTLKIFLFLFFLGETLYSFFRWVNNMFLYIMEMSNE